MNNRILKIVGLIALPLVLFIFFSLIAKGFGLHSLMIIISQCMIPTVIGYAMCIVMNAGMLDFSAGVRVVCSALLGGTLAQGMGIAGLIIGSFVGGLAGAILLGLLYRFLKIPSMVISLGIVLIYEVLGAKITGSTGYVNISNDISSIGSYPYNIVIAVIAAVILYFIMYKTKLGCQIKAVGNDEKMAKSIGIKTDRIKVMSFVISGIFCAIGAVLLISYSGSASSSTDMVTMAMVFKPMMGVLIGLQLVKLVDNQPLLIFIGEFIIAIIFNGFIAIGLSDSIQNVVLGLFLIAVMAFSKNSELYAEWKRRRSLKKAEA